MQKTESFNKTINVIDEYGNILESTYPKRAKGLVKSGRARYVDEVTILLFSCPPIENKLEDQIMNNNEIKNNIVAETKTITQEYIISKIDEIVKMNHDALLRHDLAGFSNVPGAKNPIQSICETNNKMIDFLKDAFKEIINKKSKDDYILEGYMRILEDAVDDVNSNEEKISTLINAINEYKNSK